MVSLSHRSHRLRKTPQLRSLVQEITLTKADFIMPIFVHEGLTQPAPISSMAGLFQWPLSHLLEEVKSIVDAGVQAVILFGIPTHKDELASSAFDQNGIIQKATKLIKQHYPDLVVIADLCLCEYTSHGHCGFMTPKGLDNDATLNILQQIAITYAESGVDIIAPSGMMNGAVQALRTALDNAGFPLMPILSYSVKFASGLYGPFRDAAGSGEAFKGNRKHHQINPTQRQEGLLEARRDYEQGADMIMVKPGSFYMDLIRDLKEELPCPLVVYHVSGEYAMMKLAIANGVFEESVILPELFHSFKRAGASLIITYFAKQFCRQYL